MLFKIKDISYRSEFDISVEVGKNMFDMNEFRESFIPSFCLTVYKYQGANIDEPYNLILWIKNSRTPLYLEQLI